MAINKPKKYLVYIYLNIQILVFDNINFLTSLKFVNNVPVATRDVFVKKCANLNTNLKLKRHLT